MIRNIYQRQPPKHRCQTSLFNNLTLLSFIMDDVPGSKAMSSVCFLSTCCTQPVLCCWWISQFCCFHFFCCSQFHRLQIQYDPINYNHHISMYVDWCDTYWIWIWLNTCMHSIQYRIVHILNTPRIPNKSSHFHHGISAISSAMFPKNSEL